MVLFSLYLRCASRWRARHASSPIAATVFAFHRSWYTALTSPVTRAQASAASQRTSRSSCQLASSSDWASASAMADCSSSDLASSTVLGFQTHRLPSATLAALLLSPASPPRRHAR